MTFAKTLGASTLLHGLFLAVAFLLFDAPQALQDHELLLQRVVLPPPSTSEPRPPAPLRPSVALAETSVAPVSPQVAVPSPQNEKNEKPKKALRAPKKRRKEVKEALAAPEAAPAKERLASAPTSEFVASPNEPADAEKALSQQTLERGEGALSPAGEGSRNEDDSTGEGHTMLLTAPASTNGGGQQKRVNVRELQQGYWRQVNAFVKRDYRYPRLARRVRAEGTAWIELVVDAAGRILSARVLRSSGHDVLDKAALEVVRKLRALPRPPPALRWGRRPIRIPFEYKLTRR